MARKTAQDSQKTRESILDSAEKAFLERGVNSTTIADIASIAGISRGAVYGHYKSKDDIFIAMCDRAFATVPFPDPNQNIQALEMFMKSTMQYLTLSCEESSLQRVIEILTTKCERNKENTTVWHYIEGIQANCDLQFRQLIDIAIKNGEIKEELDPGNTIMFLDSLVHGMQFMIMHWPARIDQHNWGKVEEIIQMGITAIRK